MSDPDRWSDSRLVEKSTTEKLSPSGRYRLVIRSYDQGSGCWRYTRGTVYRVSDGELVCDIKRNYSTFHHSIVTKNGEEWLITGRKYMGQTLVNLDTAQEYESNEGGFCWSSHTLSPDGNTLIVDGCFWAAPYEIKLFDFTDPSKGWEEVPITTLAEYEKHGDDPETVAWHPLPSDDLEPEFDEQGRLIAFESVDFFIPTAQREHDMSDEQIEAVGEEAYEDKANWRREVDVRSVLERRGRVFVIVEKWMSERRKEDRRRQAEWQKEDTARKLAWQASDPLWAELKARLENDPDLSLGDCWWVHPSQNDREKGEKNPAFFYPYVNSRNPVEKRRAQLKWGVLEGPLSAELWVYAKGSSSEIFERSSEGIQRAIETVRKHLKAS